MATFVDGGGEGVLDVFPSPAVESVFDGRERLSSLCGAWRGALCKKSTVPAHSLA